MRTIAHISDLHFGRVDPAVAEGLVGELGEKRPDVLVISGDLTQRARAGQYAQAAAYVGRLPRPQIIVPGNHDVPLFDVLRRIFFPLDRYRRYITADLEPYYRDDEVAILGINTTRRWTWRLGGFWKDGRISTEQLVDAKRRVGDLPERLFKILVTHHPFIPPPGERLHGIVGNAAGALNLLEQHGVDMLLAGHLHMGYSGDVRSHFEAVKRSMLSVQAGTAISTRRRDEPNAYNLLSIGGDQVTITVRAWGGKGFETDTVTEYRRNGGIWHKQDGGASTGRRKPTNLHE
ncbi:MAG TPA: metallophosphoesterase [Tepidisphaeraceae bacterium]|nr:metallophosphoesterase [Tepidisphaeraceae bacterium]